jgi:hypothetical protein
MDLASLKSMLANRPSLIDYMGGGKAHVFDGLAKAAQARTSAAQQISESAAGNSSVSVSLSPEARNILSRPREDGAANSNLSGVQKVAQDFFMSFFDQSGLDLSRLSPETLELIKGFQDVIAGAGPVQRDNTTDALEERHHDGNRKVYTLVGQGSRLRIAIDYEGGKPQKLAITDILNGQVEMANISLENAGGTPQSILLERTQRTYANGSLVDSVTKMPVSLRLYATTSG